MTETVTKMGENKKMQHFIPLVVLLGLSVTARPAVAQSSRSTDSFESFFGIKRCDGPDKVMRLLGEPDREGPGGGNVLHYYDVDLDINFDPRSKSVRLLSFGDFEVRGVGARVPSNAPHVEVPPAEAVRLSDINKILARKGIHEKKLRFIGKYYKDLTKEFGPRVTLKRLEYTLPQLKGPDQPAGFTEVAVYAPSARTLVAFYPELGKSVKDSAIIAIFIVWE